MFHWSMSHWCNKKEQQINQKWRNLCNSSLTNNLVLIGEEDEDKSTKDKSVGAMSDSNNLHIKQIIIVYVML